MRSPVTGGITVKIDHREPAVVQEIVLSDASGVERRQIFQFQVGAETDNSMGGATVRVSAQWQQEELVIESRMSMPGREAYFKDCWSLSESGRTLTMAHRDDDLAGQVSVLERVPDL